VDEIGPVPVEKDTLAVGAGAFAVGIVIAEARTFVVEVGTMAVETASVVIGAVSLAAEVMAPEAQAAQQSQQMWRVDSTQHSTESAHCCGIVNLRKMVALPPPSGHPLHHPLPPFLQSLRPIVGAARVTRFPDARG
jgi:hypothetical protein